METRSVRTRVALIGLGAPLILSLAACGSADEAPTPRAETAALVGAASPTGEVSPSPVAVSVPSGFPSVLPLPPEASIQAPATDCRVQWLLSGTDIDTVVATVTMDGRSSGLLTRIQSSRIPGDPIPTIDDWGVETLVPGPVTEMASVTFTGEGLDASLALTVPTPGVVFGEYTVREPSCSA